MEELILLLQKASENVESYIEQFNGLSDTEIENFFVSKKVSAEVKNVFLEKAGSRINKLPAKIFIQVSNWAENVEEYKNNYFARIEKMTYEELVNLIYNGIYEPTILIELTKTDIYKKYLQLEKVEQKENNLQCCDIRLKLDMASSTDLDELGIEILKLLQNTPKRTKNLDATLNLYLNTVIENIEDLNLESNSIKVCFAIMKLQMKQHQILTMKMIEFYLNARLKELNLTDVCKNVIVTLDIGEEESKIFGHYTTDGDILKGGTLRINYEYLINLFSKPNFALNNNELSDVINVNFLEDLSHELGHVIYKQKFSRTIKNVDVVEWFTTISTDKQCNYHYRNGSLQIKIGETEYDKQHQIFIEEVQADLFAFFNSNKQLLTNFKDCYPEYIVENIMSAYAKRIVTFYTSKDGTMLSPMEKFDIFYKDKIGEKEIPIVTKENPDIWDSLMTGDKIPEDLWNLLKDIADRKIVTTNLYQTITAYIQARVTLGAETNIDVSNPTL